MCFYSYFSAGVMHVSTAGEIQSQVNTGPRSAGVGGHCPCGDVFYFAETIIPSTISSFSTFIVKQ